MRPHSTTAKLLLAVLLTAALIPAHADDAPATPSASAPAASVAATVKAQMLKGLDLENVKQITYLDEQGKPLDDTSFFTLVAQGHSFSANKSKEGGTIKATLRLESKEEVEENKRVTYKVMPGETFPAFHLKRLGGGSADSKQFAGHPTLINFYFADCAPCRRESPELSALAAKYPDMRFLAVTYDQPGIARKFVKETRFTWAVAPGAGQFINQVGIRWYPSFALIDADGKLVAIKARSEIGEEEGSLAKWLDGTLAAAKTE